MTNTVADIKKVTENLNSFLCEKNKRYGDSALNPLSVFSKHVNKDGLSSINSILIRLDDKLKRVKNSSTLRKNDIVDITGYLILLCCANGWLDFKDLID